MAVSHRSGGNELDWLLQIGPADNSGGNIIFSYKCSTEPSADGKGKYIGRAVINTHSPHKKISGYHHAPSCG